MSIVTTSGKYKCWIVPAAIVLSFQLSLTTSLYIFQAFPNRFHLISNCAINRTASHCPFLFWFVDARSCSLILVVARWCSLMFVNARWCSLMLADTRWCSFILADARLSSLMLADVRWFSLILVDSRWCSRICTDHLFGTRTSSFNYLGNKRERERCGTLCSTKIKQPEISCVPLLNWRDVMLPSYFESSYFPHISAFVAFLSVFHSLQSITPRIYINQRHQ